MENKQLEPLLQVGDFVRNKIHGYITFLYSKDMSRIYFFDGIIVNTTTMDVDFFTNQAIQVGFARTEISNELEKVPATEQLILQAKDFLNNLNSLPLKLVDNLSYIELLMILNEQEKDLKNENQL